ncbi:MAG: tail fiber domain-containing protein [Bdellovibrionaceae bacterium]|nr:tail fiber domain-containing protein [Pseudobdellovibrionaceae bacterium]
MKNNSAANPFHAAIIEPYVKSPTAGSENSGVGIATKQNGVDTWVVDFAESIYAYSPIQAQGYWTYLERDGNNAFGPFLYGEKSRGTYTAKAAVQSGDDLFNIVARGYHSGSGYNDAARISFIASQNYTNTAGGGSIQFATAANNTTTPMTRMTIDNAGRVGIGTASPSYNLAVASAGPYTIISNENTAAGGADWRWYSSSSSAPLGANAMCFGQSTCHLSLYGSGNATLTGTLTQSSDGRLKRDISSIGGALDSLSGIEGVTYYWKDSSREQSRQIGLIAQDVEKVFPEAVKTDTQGIKSVAYQNLVAPIINAIHEIRNWMLQVDERVLSLENENRQLKAKSSAMEAYLCEKDPAAPFCRP